MPTPGGGTSGCVSSLPTARSALVSERSAVCAWLPSPGCVPRRGRAGLAESPRPSRERPAGPWQAVPFPPVSSVLHRLVQVAVGSLPRGGLAVMGTRACAPGRRPHALSAGLGPSRPSTQPGPAQAPCSPSARSGPPCGCVGLGHPALMLLGRPRAGPTRWVLRGTGASVTEGTPQEGIACGVCVAASASPGPGGWAPCCFGPGRTVASGRSQTLESLSLWEAGPTARKGCASAREDRSGSGRACEDPPGGERVVVGALAGVAGKPFR